MYLSDILNLCLSAIAVGISSYAIFVSQRTSKKLNETSQAQLEVHLRGMIEDTRKQVSDSEVELVKHALSVNKSEDDPLLKILKLYRNAAIERHLNVYDEACSKYLGEKIDKMTFKRLYRTEIRRLAEENEKTKDYFNDATSNYQFLIKVYKEWEDKA